MADASPPQSVPAVEYRPHVGRSRQYIRPSYAMVMFGLLFLAGAIPSMAPCFFDVTPGVGLLWAAVLNAIGLFVVSAVKTQVTDTNPWFAGLQNLAIAGIGGIAAYVIGKIFDATVA